MSSIFSKLINLAGNISGKLPTVNGGTNLDTSASTGVAKVAAGTWSVATIVDADVSSSAAITATKIQAASTTTGGVLTNGTQSIAGQKTFFNTNGTTQNAAMDASGNWIFGQTGIATGSFNGNISIGQPDFNGLTTGKTGTYNFRCGNGDTNGYDFDLLQQAFNGGSLSVFNVARNTGSVAFPQASTTASAANAFLNAGASNTLQRSTSSLRYKQDVQDLVDSAVVYKLRPITYRSKAPMDDPATRHIGLIAEEVANVETKLVQYANGVPDGIQYDRLSVLLLAEVKKLRDDVDALKSLSKKS